MKERVEIYNVLQICGITYMPPDFLWPAVCYQKNEFFQKDILRISIRASNSSETDQARRFVGPDLYSTVCIENYRYQTALGGEYLSIFLCFKVIPLYVKFDWMWKMFYSRPRNGK